MEHKTTTAFNTKLDADQGIVETVFAVMGNIDKGMDIIHNGAFTKTFAERGRKVLVLDQHQTDSVLRAVGKPLALRELSKDELPADLLADYPDATGGAWAKVQFLMDTPEGEGAFKRIKGGAINEWSFGYDALDFDHSTVKQDDEEITVRNLKTIKLYELSPVLFGMNPATTTLSAKEDAGEEPSEGKPWAAFQDGDTWNVYKLDADGNRTGESLGEHDNEGEAQAQVRALYASEDDGKDGGAIIRVPKARTYGPVCEPCAKEHGPLWQLTVPGLLEEPCFFCSTLTKTLHDLEKIPEWLLDEKGDKAPADELQAAELLDQAEELVRPLFEQFSRAVMAKSFKEIDESMTGAPAKGQAADDTSQEPSEQAGPDAGDANVPPTSNDRLRQRIAQGLIDLAILELD